MLRKFGKLQKVWVKQLQFGCMALAILSQAGCVSAYNKMVSEGQDRIETRIYTADYDLCWEAVIDSLKASPMEVVNRENGTVQTKWIDNTAERNALESHSGMIPYVKAQYRFRVSLGKGFFEGKPSVRVSVQKEQQYQRDVLEGWKPLETDSVQERSLLYRIGKLIDFKSKIRDAENKKLKKELQEAGSETSN